MILIDFAGSALSPSSPHSHMHTFVALYCYSQPSCGD